MADQLVADLVSAGTRAVAFNADVTDAAAAEAMIQVGEE